MCVAGQLLVISMLVTSTLALVGVPEDSPYCALRYRRLCQGKGFHVGCQFPEPGPGEACQNYSPIKFENNIKHFITHYINRRRQRIAAGGERVRGGLHLPKPQLMMMVEWDRELATLAQRLADQCYFAHDDCRATVRYPYAGQTVGEVRWRRSSDSDVITAQRAIRRVFDAWWGERRRVQPKQLTAPFRLTAKGAVWGHFSQLAVWSLRAVGCGAVRHGTHHPRLLLVCDFSHTNMLGQRTFTPGPLARCPMHTERRPRSTYPLLCAQVRYPVPTEHYEMEIELDSSDEEEEEEDFVTTTSTSPTEQTHCTTTSDKPIIYWTRTDKKTDWQTTQYQQDLKGTHQTRSMGAFLHKLDQELEVRQKASTKLIFSYINDFKFRPSSVAVADDRRLLRVSLLNGDRLEGIKGENTEEPYDDWKTKLYFRRPSPNNSEQYIGRHKWRPTRDRPLRPGASALLNVALMPATARRVHVSLNLDKEDIDQLFKDTGFNPILARTKL